MSLAYLTSPPILHRDLGVKFARQNVDQLRTLKRWINLQLQNHLRCKGGVWHHKRHRCMPSYYLGVLFVQELVININPNVMHI